jgi:hypothetical protein
MKKQFILSFSLLLVAILGVYLIPLERVSLKGFVLDVYQTIFDNPDIQKVQAQNQETGTVTLVVKICQPYPNQDARTDVNKCQSFTSPPQDVVNQIKVDIQRVEGTGSNTKNTTVLSDVGVGTYTLPANNPNDRDEYFVLFKNSYILIRNSNPPYEDISYDYIRRGTFDFPYTFVIKPNQNIEVVLPYLAYPGSKLETFTATIKADIVDGNGNFVRNLTDSEIQQVTFDIKYTICQFGGLRVGSFDDQFILAVSSGKLNVPYTLKYWTFYGPCRQGLGSANEQVFWNPNIKYSGYYFLDNIKPPAGYVVRSLNDRVFPDLASNTSENIIHFTQQPAPSSVIKADEMLYVPHGISYVKNLAQAYSDKEYKNGAIGYKNSSDGNRFETLVAGSGGSFEYSRPFPISWVVANFSQKPYLFMNARNVVVVYDISDPSNPIKKSEFIIPSELAKVECVPQKRKAGGLTYFEAQDTPLVERMFVLDNTPYLFISTKNTWGKNAGQAVLYIDTSDMTLRAYPQWTYCGSGKIFGAYKGSDGKPYFVSYLFPGKPLSQYSSKELEEFRQSLGKIYILSLNQSGPETTFNKFAVLTDKISDVDFDSPYSSTHILTSNNKTYLLGFKDQRNERNPDRSHRPLYIYDISNPLDIRKVNNGTITGFSIQAIDKQSGRIYVSEPMPNPLYSTSTASSKGYIPKNINGIKVYDITDPSSPKLLATYKKPSDLIDPNQFKSDILEIAKRLRISSSNSYNLDDFIPFSGVHLVGASDNLVFAYINVLERYNGLDKYVPAPDIITDVFLSCATDDGHGNIVGVDCADKSEYGASIVQFVIDAKNPSNPKILGTILPRKKLIRDSNLVRFYYFDDPLRLPYKDISPIFSYNGYIYRANYRVADIWRLGNTPTFTSQTQNDLPKNNNTQTRQPSNSLFNFNSILNVFKRAFYFQSR